MVGNTNLSDEKKAAILIECGKYHNNNTGKLVNGAVRVLCQQFHPLSKGTLCRLRARYAEDRANNIAYPTLQSRRKGKCGRKSRLTNGVRDHYMSILQFYANHMRWATLRILKLELFSKGHKFCINTIKLHLAKMNSGATNLRVKPTLTQVQKDARCKYICSQVDRRHGLQRNDHRFKDQLNTVHIDESWFYLVKVSNRIRTMPGVVVPDNPTTQHKSHITKVMFVVAFGRPQRRPDGTWFDGKIGCWPMTKRVLTQRNSINRPRGVLETKIKNVDAVAYQDVFTRHNGVFATMKNKMAWLKESGHVVQQDGAGPHTGAATAELNRLGALDGWKIVVKTQPAQSPDLNILDLGLFSSMKSRSADLMMRATNIDTLVARIMETYSQYPHEVLDKVWAHQFDVWNEILRADGGNMYKAPHQGVGRFPTFDESNVDLTVDVVAHNAVFNRLNA